MKNPFNYEYKDTSSITNALLVMIWIRIVGDVAMIFFSCLNFYLCELGIRNGDQSYVDQAAFLHLVASFPIAILNLVAFIMFLVWVNRSCKNAHSLSRNVEVKYGAGWSVGWFFVPFANLIMPYKVMAAIWNHSDPDVNMEGSTASNKLISRWWALWILGPILGRIVGVVIGLNASDIENFFGVTYLAGCIELFFSLLMSFLWLKLVKTIFSMQGQKYAELQENLPNCPECGESIQAGVEQCPLCGSSTLVSPAPMFTGPMGQEGVAGS